MSKSEQSELLRLVDVARKAYFFERRIYEIRTTGTDTGVLNLERRYPRWDGGQDANGRKHKPVWGAIVRLAVSRGIDIERLIHAVFAMQPRGPAPQPLQIAGPYGYQCYINYDSIAVETLETAFESAKDSAKQEMWKLRQSGLKVSESELWRMVITSPTIECGALFRFCLACATGQSDLANSCRHSAMIEYMNSPADYDQVTILSYLPDDFRKEARRKRELVLSRAAPL